MENKQEHVKTLLPLLSDPDKKTALLAKQYIIDHLNKHTKETWLLIAIIELHAKGKFPICLDILYHIPRELSKSLFDKLYQLIQTYQRTNILNILNHLICREPSWIHEIHRYAIVSYIIKIMQEDSDPPTLVSAILCIVQLLPIMPVQSVAYLDTTFSAFIRLNEFLLNNKQIGKGHQTFLKVSIWSLFTRLYGMFPCHLFTFLRKEFFRNNKSLLFKECIEPLLKTVQMHPLLIQIDASKEKQKNRWYNKQSFDIVEECLQLSLPERNDYIRASTPFVPVNQTASPGGAVCRGAYFLQQSEDDMVCPPQTMGLHTPPLQQSSGPAYLTSPNEKRPSATVLSLSGLSHVTPPTTPRLPSVPSSPSAHHHTQGIASDYVHLNTIKKITFQFPSSSAGEKAIVPNIDQYVNKIHSPSEPLAHGKSQKYSPYVGGFTPTPISVGGKINTPPIQVPRSRKSQNYDNDVSTCIVGSIEAATAASPSMSEIPQFLDNLKNKSSLVTTHHDTDDDEVSDINTPPLMPSLSSQSSMKIIDAQSHRNRKINTPSSAAVTPTLASPTLTSPTLTSPTLTSPTRDTPIATTPSPVIKTLSSTTSTLVTPSPAALSPAYCDSMNATRIVGQTNLTLFKSEDIAKAPVRTNSCPLFSQSKIRVHCLKKPAAQNVLNSVKVRHSTYSSQTPTADEIDNGVFDDPEPNLGVPSSLQDMLQRLLHGIPDASKLKCYHCMRSSTTKQRISKTSDLEYKTPPDLLEDHIIIGSKLHGMHLAKSQGNMSSGESIQCLQTEINLLTNQLLFERYQKNMHVKRFRSEYSLLRVDAKIIADNKSLQIQLMQIKQETQILQRNHTSKCKDNRTLETDLKNSEIKRLTNDKAMSGMIYELKCEISELKQQIFDQNKKFKQMKFDKQEKEQMLFSAKRSLEISQKKVKAVRELTTKSIGMSKKLILSNELIEKYRHQLAKYNTSKTLPKIYDMKVNNLEMNLIDIGKKLKAKTIHLEAKTKTIIDNNNKLILKDKEITELRKLMNNNNELWKCKLKSTQEKYESLNKIYTSCLTELMTLKGKEKNKHQLLPDYEYLFDSDSL